MNDTVENEIGLHERNLESLRLKADGGDLSATFSIAQMYWIGEGVEKDESAAVKLFLKSADCGHANSQYWLGSAYLKGDGVRKNAPNAAKWLRSAADQNMSDAQFDLAELLLAGQGAIKANHDEAILWMNRAAELGHAKAKEYLIAIEENSEADIKEDVASKSKSKILNSTNLSLLLLVVAIGAGYLIGISFWFVSAGLAMLLHLFAGESLGTRWKRLITTLVTGVVLSGFIFAILWSLVIFSPKEAAVLMITTTLGWGRTLSGWASVIGVVFIVFSLMSQPRSDRRFKTGYKNNQRSDYSGVSLGWHLIIAGIALIVVMDQLKIYVSNL